MFDCVITEDILYMNALIYIYPFEYILM